MTYLKSRRFIGAAFTAITMLSITRTITGNGDLTSTVIVRVIESMVIAVKGTYKSARF